MKKILGIIVLAAASCCAQTTPNIGLNLPVYSTPNWNIPLNQNFSILDNYLGGVNAFPNPLKASVTGAAGGLLGGSLGSIPYQVTNGQTALLGPNTTTSNLFLCEQGTGSVGAAPGWCAGTGGGVSSFAAPSVSWPSWLTPTVTNSTTTPSLAVAASAIPNSALANPTMTVNGVGCTLGSTCTVPAAAGTLSGSALASGVTTSSLTSVGTISSGMWQGTPIANSYLAHNYTTVNGQVCTLGGSCITTSGLASSLSGGSLGSIPYQSSASSTAMLNPNTTPYTYYLCETGTGTAGAPPQWCAQTSPSGTVTSVNLLMPSGQFTVTGSPITSSGTFSVTLNSPTGSGAIVLAASPTISNLTATSSFTATGLVTNADLANASTTVNGQTCTLGSSCSVSTSTPNSVTFNNGGSGASSGSTFNGGSALTVSYNTIGAAASNASTTVNGQTCTLGSTCTVTAAAAGIVVGTTTVGSGSSGYILYDNGGTLGNLATTGSGSVVLAVNPALTGVPTAPTAIQGTNTTQIATTANALADAEAYSSVSWYWNIQPLLYTNSTMLGPVFYTPVSRSSSGQIIVRTTGTISCTAAPTAEVMDLGTSPSTAYGSATSIVAVATSTSDGLFVATGSSLTANHYYGVAFINGVCTTAPTIDVSYWFQ